VGSVAESFDSSTKLSGQAVESSQLIIPLCDRLYFQV